MSNFLDKTAVAAAPAAKVAPVRAASPATLRPAQLDGNQTTNPAKPTKAPLQTRVGSPNNYNTSGMERGMAELADKMHPVRPRR